MRLKGTGTRHLLGAVAIGGIVLGVGAAPADAAIISAYELIQDVETTFDTQTRDLSRTREIIGGTSTVENTDATIVSDNNVSDRFGVFGVGAINEDDDVTYTHTLDWLVPPSSAYLSAVLTIVAYDVGGNNDEVFTDTVLLGTLLGGSSGAVTTSVFSSVTLLAQLVDDTLNISIDFTNNDSITIISSRLDVRYSDGVPDTAPEPLTLSLLGLGLVGIGYGARRRRRSAA